MKSPRQKVKLGEKEATDGNLQKTHFWLGQGKNLLTNLRKEDQRGRKERIQRLGIKGRRSRRVDQQCLMPSREQD